MKLLWHFKAVEEFNAVRACLPAGVDIVHVRTDDDLRVHIADADATVCGQGIYQGEAAKLYKTAASKLRWIQLRASGTDNAARWGFPLGVTVTNAPGMSSAPISEHLMSMMLVLNRRLHEWMAIQAGHAWNRDTGVIGRMGSLDGRTVAVIGYGAIAQAFCIRAKAFGMRVVVVSRAAEPGPHVDAVVRRDKLGGAVAAADVVAICTALTPETHHLLGRAELARMKPTATVLNIGRGELIDEAALIDALRDGRIGGAGLDVTTEEPCPSDNPLWSMKNVILSPHVAARGGNDVELFARLATENVRRYLAGETLLHVMGPDRLAPPPSGSPGKA